MENIFDFTDKVVLVTGGAGTGGGASGKFISMFFAECGAKVVIADKEVAAAEAVAQAINEAGGTAVVAPGDLCDEAVAKAASDIAVDTFGKLDILVNNAFWHAMEQPDVAEYSVAEWDEHMDINLRQPFLVTKYALPHLVQSGDAAIVNISTTGAHRGEPGYCAYSAAKAGLESLTRSLAAQYGRDGVRCNCIAPGLVLSDEMDAYIASDPSMSTVFDLIDENMLLWQGHGSGRDVAYLTLFLASSAARYLTGQVIVLAGGTTAHFPQWANMRKFLKSVRGN